MALSDKSVLSQRNRREWLTTEVSRGVKGTEGSETFIRVLLYTVEAEWRDETLRRQERRHGKLLVTAFAGRSPLACAPLAILSNAVRVFPDYHNIIVPARRSPMPALLCCRVNLAQALARPPSNSQTR